MIEIAQYTVENSVGNGQVCVRVCDSCPSTLHLSKDTQIIVDDFDLRKIERDGMDRAEQEADELTSASLIPKRYWERISPTDPISSDEVKAMAERLKIHPAIIAGRIRFERNNYRLLTRLVGQGKIRELFNDLE